MLGVNAALGRTIVPSDDSPSAPPVGVVSFRYWQDRLNGAPSAVGSTVDLNGVSVAIVGVAPPGFHGETLQPDPPGFWLPISADRHLNPARTVIDDAGAHWLYLMGRLKPGLSAAQGEARLTSALQNWLITREGSTFPTNSGGALPTAASSSRPAAAVSPACDGTIHRRCGFCWASRPRFC